MHDHSSPANAQSAEQPASKAQGPIEDIYPLTDMQNALLVRCVTYPDQPVYMGQWWAEIEGPIDGEAFGAAWRSVVQRHSALRSAFHWELKDQPFQVVHREPDFAVENLDWSGDTAWRDRLSTYLEEDRQRPFDLKRPPLMRVRLIKIGEDRHLIVWTRHHLVVDGWSLGVLLDEVFTVYRSIANDEPVSLKPATPFRSYVDWHRGRDSAVARAHWKRVLAELEAPPAPGAPLGSAIDLGERVETLDAATTSRIADAARQARLTPNTLVQAAWALVLSRISGMDEVLYGAVETLRPAHLLDDASGPLVGPQIAILPVRARIDSTPLGDWLHRLQADMIAGREAGAVGLDVIRDLIGGPRHALPFDSMVGFQNYPLDERGPVMQAGLIVRDGADISLPDMPLNMMVETGDTMTLRLMYDRRYKADGEADQILAMLANTLGAMPGQFDTPVETIDVLPPALARRLLNVFSGFGPIAVADPTVPELILRHAEDNPDTIALRFAGKDTSYRELVTAASHIAEQILRHDDSKQKRIGVLLERSPQAFAAMIGVMLAGAAYVPLDPNTAPNRRERILQTAGVRTVVTSSAHTGDVGDRHVIVADELALEARPALTHALPSPDDEAYVIFTSGSTGQPKGVVVDHSNLRYHIAARKAVYPDNPIDTFLLNLPLHFDGSITVVFCTLATGGTLVLAEKDEAMDPDRLAALIGSAGVTQTAMAPSLWRMILEAASPEQLKTMQLTIVAIEACSVDLVRDHYEKLPNAPLYNEYGATETTVWVTAHRCGEDFGEPIEPLGRPVAGTRAYVVDRHNRLCPPGTMGELIFAGPAIARGYIGLDEQAVSGFERNRFDDDPWFAPAYRTGDLARFDLGGRLWFHGRADRQVKLNGNRIELGEIEACLASHPAIKEAIVVILEADSGPARLVAHIVAAEPLEQADIRHFLGLHLPAYMIPQAVLQHESLPRTSTGKIVLSKLPVPEVRTSSEPPEGERENALATIWREALGREEIGRHEDFFDLGGDSLTAMLVVSRIRRDMKLGAELLDLFEAPEIAELATRLAARDGAESQTTATLVPRQRARVELPIGQSN